MTSIVRRMAGLPTRGRRGAARAAALAAAILAFCCGGCSDDGPSGPETPGAPASRASLYAGTHLVDDLSSPLEFEYAIDSTYVYRIVHRPPLMEKGHVIIGSAGEGYIRRVTGVSVSGDRMILETTRARLTDAVLHGAMYVSIPVGFGSTAAAMPAEGVFLSTEGDLLPAECVFLSTEGVRLTGGGVGISGLSIFEREISGHTAAIRIEKGFIEFNPAVHIGLTIVGGEIERLESRVDGIFASGLDLSVDIPEPMEMEGELLLASARRRIVHEMGDVPVVALVELDLLLSYRFTGRYSGDCGAGFRNAIDLTLGARHERGGWMDISALEPEASGTPPVCAEYSNAEMRISIEPRIRVALFGERFAAAACAVHGGFTVDAIAPPVWEWSMSSGLEGRYEIDPDVLAARPAGYAIEPLLRTASLGSGPYRTDSYIFVLAWGSEGPGDGEFAYPRGAAVDPAGDVYVVDSWNNRVQKFAPDSTFIMKWGSEGQSDGQFLFPADAAVDSYGNIYITDSGNDRVQKFGPGGAFIAAWGSSGSGPGEFHEPAGIAVDPSGDVYVADSGNNRVQKFTADGLLVAEWGGYGTAPGMFDRPIGIAADGEGNIYVTECRNHRVQKFTSSGEALALWGSAGTGAGEFDCPVAVATDAEGFIYVADYGNDRLQIFDPQGLFFEEIGGPGSGEGGFDRPEGVAVDQRGLIYVVDSRNERVQKFAPRNP